MLSEFHHFFAEMLPEHKNVLMQELVGEESQCTAIMLACTCKQERLRYKTLGYKWPFAAARLSAARNGYYELFQWLIGQCYPDRCTDREYMQQTWRTVCKTPNLELFKWYAGPGYFYKLEDLQFFSWRVFAGAYAGYMEESSLRNILYSTVDVWGWGLEPFYYHKKRFGVGSLEDIVVQVGRAVGKFGTFDDISGLELESFLNRERRESYFSYCLLGSSIEAGNINLLNALFEHWPDEMAKVVLERDLFEYVAHTYRISVPLLEACQRCGIPVDTKEVVKRFLRSRAKNVSYDTKLTKDLRSLVEYAGWRLPEIIETIRQCADWLWPEPDNGAWTVAVSSALNVTRLVDSL
jgi:hypothetical protein